MLTTRLLTLWIFLAIFSVKIHAKDYSTADEDDGKSDDGKSGKSDSRSKKVINAITSQVADIGIKLGAQLLESTGPLGATLASFLMSMLGQEADAGAARHEEILHEFAQLHERLDDIEQSLKELKSYVGEVAVFVQYENEVLLRLHVLNNASLRYAKNPNEHNQYTFRKACETNHPPLEISTKMDYFLFNDRYPPFFYDEVFNKAGYNRKLFHTFIKFIVGDIIELSSVWQLCMKVAKYAPDQEDKMSALEFTNHTLKRLHDKLVASDQKIVDEWYGEPLAQDIKNVTKVHAESYNYDTAYALYSFLSEKYYWNRFKVITFNTGAANGDWAHSGHLPDDDEKSGMVVDSGTPDARMAIVMYARKDKETTVTQERKDAIVLAMQKFQKDDYCYYHAGTVVAKVRADFPKYGDSKLLTATRVFAITLPNGGRWSEWNLQWYDNRRIGVAGDDGLTTTANLCYSREAAFYGCSEYRGCERNEEKYGRPLTLVILQYV